jgi:hypothetical protein
MSFTDAGDARGRNHFGMEINIQYHLYHVNFEMPSRHPTAWHCHYCLSVRIISKMRKTHASLLGSESTKQQ